MTAVSVAVDSNLLLLLVVGSTSRDLVLKHKRLNAYRREDFDLLISTLSRATEIVVTPNTLSETSNLIDHIDDPVRSQIYRKLTALLSLPDTRELYIESSLATKRSELPRLGLTDCALLEAFSRGVNLVTVDLQLYLVAASMDPSRALNFNHVRDLSMSRENRDR